MGKEPDLDKLVELQGLLTNAIDSFDINRIEKYTTDLATLLEAISQTGIMPTDNDRAELHIHALRQNEALTTRLKFHAQRNRQKLDDLLVMRSRSSCRHFKNKLNTYSYVNTS